MFEKAAIAPTNKEHNARPFCDDLSRAENLGVTQAVCQQRRRVTTVFSGKNHAPKISVVIPAIVLSAEHKASTAFSLKRPFIASNIAKMVRHIVRQASFP